MFLLLTFSTVSTAQEGIPVYFDYLSDNYYLVHPSMAGIGEGGKIRLTARKQWFSVEEGPKPSNYKCPFLEFLNQEVG